LASEEEDRLFEQARKAPEGDLRAFESLAQQHKRRIVTGRGIAFGFGIRNVVRPITAGFYLRKHLQVGRQIEISGENQEISVANAAFLEQIAKQSG